ncbi:DNA repair protein RecN [Jiulongibacter sediminis]|nr:DNA repair protein RecN [Jiulongibacter sediminis]TBX26357.1 DNA repair protein [Jiulongibacter sediminis]
MLAHLQIKNYALIQQLEISPDAELNIITGETGAGKSIMLGALGLLMGKRADVKALFDQEKKCVVEGTFQIEDYKLQSLFESLGIDYENPCLIRREIAPNGKSRAFVNDSPVTLDILKHLADRLIDVHSQHDSIMLADSSYQLNLLDAYAESQNELSAFEKAYGVYAQSQNELKRLEAESKALQKEFDYNSFLLEELSEANLKAGEQEEAEEKLDVLENAEEVKLKLSQVSGIINHPEQSLISALQDAHVQLNSISKYSSAYSDLKKRLQSVQVELSDIADEVSIEEEKVEYDPEQIQVLKDRLDLIFRLQQKHQVQDIESLLTIQKELSVKVENVLDFDNKLNKLKKSLELATKELEEAGQNLREKREAISPQMQNKVVNLLKELGIPNAAFSVQLTEKEPAADGLDKAEFLFSANKGFELQSLKKVASGGEFSRLMLALKYILAEKAAMPTLIFDEVDTGISGEVAVKMGNLMREMSKNLQLIAITHLHQIAGKGTSHFFVYKADTSERTISSMKKLNQEERILEIAKMIGGNNPSESSIKSAIELMDAI